MTALIFDCDGVLADTERDGHRPAFNQTFREFGLPVEWSEEVYGAKLQIAGGKERMASELTPEFVRANGLPEDAEGQAAELAKWHKRKTQIYTDMVAAGRLPTRPGIRRIITAAQDAGWTLGGRLDLGRAVRPGDPRAGHRARAGRPLRPRPRRRRRREEEARSRHLPARPAAARRPRRADARRRGLA